MAWHYEERTPQQQPSRCRYLFLLHQMLLVPRSFTASRMTVGREGSPVTLPPRGGYILIDAKGVDTTTLSGKAAVKPKNPWAAGPSNLRTFSPRPSGAPYFLATTATARMMRAMPMSSQKPKVRWKMRKEKMMEDSGSMAEMMLASVGRMKATLPR